MGLGKTLQLISLIMTGGKGSTLIVAPVSVMSNWKQQIDQHVLEEHAPNVLIYHGAGRESSLSKYDVVITSYGTLSSEASHGPLSKVTWRRIVLDEGHIIRNAKTKVAEHACLLKAQSRWVLTGTPIINSIRDLHSLLKFLRITGGIEQYDIFNTAIARPLSLGQARAEALLQNLMGDICLRRKKDMKFVDLRLPPKTEYIHRIAFWPGEQKKYDALLSEAQGALAEYQKKSQAGQKIRFQGVLERLLRLRQTCNHWTLCKERISDILKLLEGEEAVVALNPKNYELLQQALQLVVESQSEECPVCIDDLKAACHHTLQAYLLQILHQQSHRVAREMPHVSHRAVRGQTGRASSRAVCRGGGAGDRHGDQELEDRRPHQDSTSFPQERWFQSHHLFAVDIVPDRDPTAARRGWAEVYPYRWKHDRYQTRRSYQSSRNGRRNTHPAR